MAYDLGDLVTVGQVKDALGRINTKLAAFKQALGIDNSLINADIVAADYIKSISGEGLFSGVEHTVYVTSKGHQITAAINRNTNTGLLGYINNSGSRINILNIPSISSTSAVRQYSLLFEVTDVQNTNTSVSVTLKITGFEMTNYRTYTEVDTTVTLTCNTDGSTTSTTAISGTVATIKNGIPYSALSTTQVGDKAVLNFANGGTTNSDYYRNFKISSTPDGVNTIDTQVCYITSAFSTFCSDGTITEPRLITIPFMNLNVTTGETAASKITIELTGDEVLSMNTNDLPAFDFTSIADGETEAGILGRITSIEI